jgi:hypothetical protein
MIIVAALAEIPSALTVVPQRPTEQQFVDGADVSRVPSDVFQFGVFSTAGYSKRQLGLKSAAGLVVFNLE